MVQKPCIVPIPGTTELYGLAENNAGTSIVLSTDELDEINISSLQIKIMGERYTEQISKMTGL